MTLCMGGISYTELKEMDLAEFAEAEQARLLWLMTMSRSGILQGGKRKLNPERRDDLWMRPAVYHMA